MSKIEEQAIEADRIHKELYPELYEKDELPKDKVDPVTPQDSDKKEDVVDGTVNDTVVDKVTVTPIPTEVKKEDQDDFKQKYFVLKGKYDAEVPRLQHELSELRKTVTEIQDNKPKPVVEDKSDTTDDLLNDPDLRFLSDEYPDVFKALIAFQKRATKKVDTFDSSVLEKKIERLEQATAKTKEERFSDDLNKMAPDWATINDNPRFIDWLNEMDDLTGYTRLQLATVAQNNLDGSRVAAFYNTFKKSNGLVEKKDDSGDKNQRKDMSKYVAPNTTKRATVDKIDEPEIITRDFINKFYSDARKGAFNGRDDAYNKIEAKIEKALLEGRIEG